MRNLLRRDFCGVLFTVGLTIALLPLLIKADEPGPSLELEAFQYGRNLTHGIQSNREYVSILNQLNARPEYFEFSSYLDMLATWYTFVGHYEKAIRLGDRAFPRPVAAIPIDLDSYNIKDAVEFITQESITSQVVMVNEEHRMPQHRALATQLLAPLYRNGYRYFAVETLTADSALMVSGEPVLSSGFYSKEPVFGEMLRVAAELGYKLVPYEMLSFPDSVRKMHPMKRQIFREDTQARNLVDRILKEDPQGKILVYAGRGHVAEVLDTNVVEGERIPFGMMAGFFKERSGIDPLTIDQLVHEEHSDTIYESSMFRRVRAAPAQDFHFFNALVTKDTHEILANDVYDVTVVPSLTEYDSGRPAWLAQLPDRHAVKIDVTEYQPQDSSYFLVQAIRVGEDPERSVPADQYAFRYGADTILLLLRPGSYTMRILDQGGEILKDWEETID